MRYREDLELSLKNLSFKIESGIKIGIVGRSGSGKSSILQVLFRLQKLERGKIFIDGQKCLDFNFSRQLFQQ